MHECSHRYSFHRNLSAQNNFHCGQMSTHLLTSVCCVSRDVHDSVNIKRTPKKRNRLFSSNVPCCLSFAVCRWEAAPQSVADTCLRAVQQLRVLSVSVALLLCFSLFPRAPVVSRLSRKLWWNPQFPLWPVMFFLLSHSALWLRAVCLACGCLAHWPP